MIILAMSGKKRKGIFDIFEEIEKAFEKPEASSGYSITVTYDESGRPVIDVKTYGDVDEDALRRELEKNYPGAKIRGLKKKPLIERVDEEE